MQISIKNNKCNQCYKAAEKIKTDPEYAVQFSRKISNGIKKHKLEHPEFSAGENNPMFGKHHSDTAKQKISESRKGDKNWAFGKHWYHDKYGNRKMFYPKDVPDGWFRKMR